MSSNEFIMRTMIPSSQRATKEYKTRDEMIREHEKEEDDENDVEIIRHGASEG